MARVVNPSLQGLSGTVGDLTFRTWGGKTFVNPKPIKRKKQKQSEAQKATRIRFREASFRARHTLADPTMREHYQQKARQLNLPNAYTAALREQMMTMING